MYNNDAKFQTDYEYNHSLDAYMQESYKIGYIGELGHQSQKHLDTLVRDIFRI